MAGLASYLFLSEFKLSERSKLGKLIGAVTHVFVQDSARGYGIFIENMLRVES